MQPLADLKDFDFVSKLAPAEARLLSQGLRFADYAKAQRVLSKGTRIAGAFLVLRGRLRIYTISDTGLEGTLYWVERGGSCIFALNSLFNEVLYPAWAEAETASRVAIVPGRVFRRLFEAEPAVHRFVFNALASLVFDLTTNLDRLLTSSLEARLAGFLLTRAGQSGEVRMSQERIAGQLGTAREVVSRRLGDFRARGWVETGRGLVKVLDAEAMASACAGRLAEGHA